MFANVRPKFGRIVHMLPSRTEPNVRPNFGVRRTSVHLYCLVSWCFKASSCCTGWPQLHWFVTEHLSKPPKDWLPPPRPSDNAAAYIEVGNDGGVLSVVEVFHHCQRVYLKHLVSLYSYSLHLGPVVILIIIIHQVLLPPLHMCPGMHCKKGIG